MHEALEPIAGLSVARVPLLPLRVGESLLSSSQPLTLLREILATRSDCRLAILLASPDLYRAMNDWIAGRPLKNAKAPLKLLAYVMRMSTRPTPFGAFAAIGAVDAGPHQTLHLRAVDARSCRFRPDAAWLYAQTSAIEGDPRRRDALEVRLTEAIREHGDRIYMTNCAPHRSSAGDEVVLRAPASVRKAAAVAAVLRAGRELARYGAIVSNLATEFAVPQATSRRLVDDLWDAGAFVPVLRPPPVASALDHVIAHLPVEESALRARLLDHRARFEALSTPAGIVAEHEAAAAIDALRADAPDLNYVVHVDTTVAFEGTLASRVLDDAGILAALLVRNGRELRLRRLQEEWQRRFDTTGVLMPLLDFVDPDVGFGDPGALEAATLDAPENDAVRIAAAAEALALGRDEIELSDDDIARWLPAPPGSPTPLASVELAFTLIAASAEDVDAGRYRICAAPFAFAGAGRSLGRFADVLPAATMGCLQTALTAEADDAIHAQLIYAAPSPRSENVRTRGRLYDYHIDLGVHAPGAERLSPRDLFVGLDERGFYLFSQHYQRRVVVHETDVLSTPAEAPALIRFLSLLGNQHVTPRHFAWGAAEHFPALPRVRFGRVVLSERRWRLPARLFAGSMDDVAAAVRAWRLRWRCPARVRFGAKDGALAVNLEAPEFLALIQEQQRAAPGAPVDVREILETPDSAVLHGNGDVYAAEFIASFRTRLPNHLTAPRPHVHATIFDAPAVYGIGSTYVYLKLYCARHRMDRFLTSEIGPAAERLVARDLADRWFFIRYADPDPHIRLRLRATNGTASALRDELFALAETWLAAKLCHRVAADTYVPETARYGGIDAFDFIEHTFMESSRATCLALVPEPSDLRDRLRRAARTAQDLFAPLVRRLGMSWWLEAFAHQRSHRDRDFQRDLKLVSATLRDTAGPQPSDACMNALVDLSENGQLNAPLTDVVSAMLHMHVNRCGVEPQDEIIVRDLIAQAYRSFTARTSSDGLH